MTDTWVHFSQTLPFDLCQGKVSSQARSDGGVGVGALWFRDETGGVTPSVSRPQDARRTHVVIGKINEVLTSK